MPADALRPSYIMPRLVSREDAARYASVSPSTFDKMVRDGSMPRPKSVSGRRVAWDVRALDAAIDDMPTVGGPAVADTWND